MARLLLGLEVVEEDAALLGLLTPILDDDARAVDDLAGVAFAVDLAWMDVSPLFPQIALQISNLQETLRSSKSGVVISRTETSPLAELLAVGDLDERDLVLAAKRDNELLVCLLLASLVEHAHVRLATIERLARLAQTTRKTVVDERKLEHTLESLEHAHLALSGGSIGADLDLLGGRNGLVVVVFSVRLCALLVRVSRWPLKKSRGGVQRARIAELARCDVP